MDEQTFQQRPKVLGHRVIKVVESLPMRRTPEMIPRQFVRCGTSVGANHPAACRARSDAEVMSRLAVVEEEADETVYWLETLVEVGIVPARKLNDLINEANQILAMTVASIKTLKAKSERRANQSKIRNPKSKMERRR